MADHISWREFRESHGVDDWRNLSGGAMAMFRAESFAQATTFAAEIGRIDGVEDRRPSVDIRHHSVTVQLLTVTDTYSGMSQQDVMLAREISALARNLNLTPDPSAVQSLLIYVGTPPNADVLPFWRAVLGYEAARGNPDEGATDPHLRGPGLWVEQMEEPRPGGGGAIHVAIWVPHEEAEARVAAALSAGGTLVRGEYAPAWWTLADAAGNEADIATTMGRD